MLRGMSLAQLYEWRAFLNSEEMNPTEDLKADFRAASIVVALYNLFARKKGQKAYDIADFLLIWDPKKRPKPKQRSWQDLKLIGQMMAAAYGPDDKPSKKPKKD